MKVGQTYNNCANIFSLVGNIVSNICCLFLWKSPYLTPGNFVWFTTILWTLKEEKQDTSHILLPCKRANEIGNLMPLSLIRWRYFNYSFKGFWCHDATLLVYFDIIRYMHSFHHIHTVHSSIVLAEVPLHLLIDGQLSGKTSLGCWDENRTRASLTASRALPTELCLTLLSYAAPYWATPHPTIYFNFKVMCQKFALQCQLTCLYKLYTVNPSPLPSS